MSSKGFEKKDESISDYVGAVEKLKFCLAEKDEKAAEELGNDVTALLSVPVAIYSFLRVRDSNVTGA